jgi:hypothetical protein
MDIIPLTPEQQTRYLEIQQLLESRNIKMRNDSDLCWDYIFHNTQARIADPQEIARMMEKAKYLHEYCNFELGYQIAQNTIQRTGKVHKESWLALLRKCVLMTTDLKRYPKEWPWTLGICAESWKQEHDISSQI